MSKFAASDIVINMLKLKDDSDEQKAKIAFLAVKEIDGGVTHHNAILKVLEKYSLAGVKVAYESLMEKDGVNDGKGTRTAPQFGIKRKVTVGVINGQHKIVRINVNLYNVNPGDKMEVLYTEGGVLLKPLSKAEAEAEPDQEETESDDDAES